jgi:Icc-related predicted phosphoesterase
MLIAATGDVHSPRFYEDFIRALDRLKAKPDLMLLTGDMVERGNVPEYEKIYNGLFGKVNCPIVACFGNNEFQPLRDEIRAKFKDIKFLDDEATILQIGNKTVGIVGTIGSLDVPTSWQKRNIPNIERTYQERVGMVERLFQRMRTDMKILLTHYAPTYKTLVGENPNFYANMGSRMFEDVLIKQKPTLAVHGHSHRGTKLAWVDTIPVFNVSLSLNKEVVLINTEEDLKPGIAKFI